jgi:phosphoenolpyruvate synthase/pyruvate phosphate dikinase
VSRKGVNLAILAAHGVTVPRGFLLEGAHYSRAISKSFDDIEVALGDADSLERFFAELEIPADTLDYLDRKIGKCEGADRFAVRSSGNVVARGMELDEDGTDTALAGQFDSFLSVPRELIPIAIRACWGSLFNARSQLAFDIDRSYIENSTMSVVVQEMVVASASAVMMTADPLGDGTTGSIDLTVGPCEALVSGIVSPDEVVFTRDTGDIISYVVGRKERSVVYEDFITGANALIVANSADTATRSSVGPKALRRIVDVGQKIEAIFKSPQDIELVVTGTGEVVITQSRPVTAAVNVAAPFNNTNHQ